MSTDAPGPLWLRLVWFIGLWTASVACVAAVGYIIRIWLV